MPVRNRAPAHCHAFKVAGQTHLYRDCPEFLTGMASTGQYPQAVEIQGHALDMTDCEKCRARWRRQEGLKT